MDQMEDLVEELYKFRDHFFENHDLAKAKEKHGMVKAGFFFDTLK